MSVSSQSIASIFYPDELRDHVRNYYDLAHINLVDMQLNILSHHITSVRNKKGEVT